MELAKGNKGYANRTNAVKQLAKVLGGSDKVECVLWWVVALENGRFIPAVAYRGWVAETCSIPYLTGNNVAVVG